MEEGLPNFFIAENAQLVDSARAAIGCLQLEGRPSYMLVRDEVVFAKSYNLLYGLQGEEPLVVGGIHPGHSRISREAMSEDSLSDEFLASICVSSCLKGIDKRSRSLGNVSPMRTSSFKKWESWQQHVLCNVLAMLFRFRKFYFLQC